jgi:hypothetical protein
MLARIFILLPEVVEDVMGIYAESAFLRKARFALEGARRQRTRIERLADATA